MMEVPTAVACDEFALSPLSPINSPTNKLIHPHFQNRQAHRRGAPSQQHPSHQQTVGNFARLQRPPPQQDLIDQSALLNSNLADPNYLNNLEDVPPRQPLTFQQQFHRSNLPVGQYQQPFPSHPSQFGDQPPPLDYNQENWNPKQLQIMPTSRRASTSKATSISQANAGKKKKVVANQQRKRARRQAREEESRRRSQDLELSEEEVEDEPISKRPKKRTITTSEDEDSEDEYRLTDNDDEEEEDEELGDLDLEGLTDKQKKAIRAHIASKDKEVEEAQEATKAAMVTGGEINSEMEQQVKQKTKSHVWRCIKLLAARELMSLTLFVLNLLTTVTKKWTPAQFQKAANTCKKSVKGALADKRNYVQMQLKDVAFDLLWGEWAPLNDLFALEIIDHQTALRWQQDPHQAAFGPEPDDDATNITGNLMPPIEDMFSVELLTKCATR